MTNYQNIRVEIIQDIKSLKTLDKAWNCLLENSPEKNPFLSFSWIYTWWEVFGKNRRLFVIVVYSKSQIIGIFPLMISDEAHFFFTIRRMQFIGIRKSDYLGPILTDKPELCWHVAIESIYRHRKLWDDVEFGRMRKESNSFLQLLNILNKMDTVRKLVRQDKDCKGCPAILIEGSWEQYFKQQMSDKGRETARRKLRKIEKAGNVSFSEAGKVERLDDILEEIGALERKSWKGREGNGIFQNESDRAFFLKISSAFAESGWLSIYTLRVNDQPIAFFFGFKYNNRYYYYNSSYDSLWKSCSPSLLLLMKIIQDCFENNFKEVDFLQGEENYKLKLSNKIWNIYKVLLFHGGYRSTLLFYLEKHLRPLAVTIKKKILNRSHEKY